MNIVKTPVQHLGGCTALRARSSAALIGITSFILLFYLSYRYPFQINFSGTSQSYTDTPFSLQIGKFLLAAAACVIAVCQSSFRRIDMNRLMLLLIMILLFSFALLKGLLSDKVYIEVAFWAGVSLTLALYSPTLDINSLNIALARVFQVSIVVELIQIFLFFWTGRLPALAWEGSISIRFGSFLDDPNGFAALCFLFLGWSCGKHRGVGRLSYVTAAVSMILLSQSLTAIVFLMALIFSYIIYNLLNPKLIISIVVTVILVGVLIFAFTAGSNLWRSTLEVLDLFFQHKQESIDQHLLFQFSDVFGENAVELCFGSSEYVFYESWWVQSSHNMGIVWTLALFLISAYGTLLTVRYAYRSEPGPAKSVWLGLAIFNTYFLLGGFNLPLFSVFPLNYVFFVNLACLFFGRLGYVRPLARSALV